MFGNKGLAQVSSVESLDIFKTHLPFGNMGIFTIDSWKEQDAIYLQGLIIIQGGDQIHVPHVWRKNQFGNPSWPKSSAVAGSHHSWVFVIECWTTNQSGCLVLSKVLVTSNEAGQWISTRIRNRLQGLRRVRVQQQHWCCSKPTKSLKQNGKPMSKQHPKVLFSCKQVQRF